MYNTVLTSKWQYILTFYGDRESDQIDREVILNLWRIEKDTARYVFQRLVCYKQWESQYVEAFGILFGIGIPLIDIVKASYAADIGWKYSKDLVNKYSQKLSRTELEKFTQELFRFKCIQSGEISPESN